MVLAYRYKYIHMPSTWSPVAVQSSPLLHFDSQTKYPASFTRGPATLTIFADFYRELGPLDVTSRIPLAVDAVEQRRVDGQVLLRVQAGI
jgi:hypothetical protein